MSEKGEKNQNKNKEKEKEREKQDETDVDKILQKDLDITDEKNLESKNSQEKTESDSESKLDEKENKTQNKLRKSLEDDKNVNYKDIETDLDIDTGTENKKVEEDNLDLIEERQISKTDTTTKNGIGHIIGSEKIELGTKDHNLKVYIDTEMRSRVRINDYVEIPIRERYLFCKIRKLSYEPGIEIKDKKDDFSKQKHQEGEYVLIADLEPITILQTHKEGGIRRSIVNEIPKPNSRVYLCREEKKLCRGLNIPIQGVAAGFISIGGEPIDIEGRKQLYYIKNPKINEKGEPVIFKHLLVAGSTGAGKTHFTKNLLRQLKTQRKYQVGSKEKELNIVVLDPDSEYSEMKEDNSNLSSEKLREYRDMGLKVGGIENLETFVPSVKGSNPPSNVKSYRSFCIPFDIVKERPWLMMPYSGDDSSQITRSAISRCIRSYFNDEKRSGGNYTYNYFLNYLNRNMDYLCDEHNIDRSTWGAMQRRIKQGAYSTVFDQGSNGILDITNEVFRSGRVSVIPTKHLSGSEEKLVVLCLLSIIIENKLKEDNPDKNIKNTPILLSVDEAHNYLSEEKNNPRQGKIINKVREAVKQGRKYKLGLMMVSQNPHDISERILEQVNTNVFLNLRSEVVEGIPSVPSDYKRDIPEFEKGQAVIDSVNAKTTEIVGIEDCLLKHSN